MGKAELGASYAAINELIPEGWVWQYRTTLRDSRVIHEWTLNNGDCGAHIHCWRVDYDGRYTREWLGGVECHRSTPFDYSNSDKPDHEHCWLLGKPCWHDGTSLGFSENVAPCLPDSDDLEPFHHRYATAELVRYARSWFPEAITRLTNDGRS